CERQGPLARPRSIGRRDRATGPRSQGRRSCRRAAELHCRVIHTQKETFHEAKAIAGQPPCPRGQRRRAHHRSPPPTRPAGPRTRTAPCPRAMVAGSTRERPQSRSNPATTCSKTLSDAHLRVVTGGVAARVATETKDPWPDPATSGNTADSPPPGAKGDEAPG